MGDSRRREHHYGRLAQSKRCVMHAEYRLESLKQLRDQQVRFAPRDKRQEQINRAEQLIAEIDSVKTYSYEYLCFRITDYRPSLGQMETMTGDDARHDLRFFVEDVSDSLNLKVESVTEPVRTVDELSRAFNVSTKTISRWREQGLVSRKFVFSNGRKRVGFLQSSVDRFVADNREKVKRGERFSQLSENDRDEIVERARRLARAGGCPAEVARRIAKSLNRSVETIRYTIKHFDEKHPELAIFPDRTGPLTLESKQEIYDQFLEGRSPDSLAKKYCRTRSTVYRLVNEMRARKILELPLDFMDNEEFHRKNADSRILTPMPANQASRKSKPPSGLPTYLSALYQVPLLSREQEYHLFRKFNFLKYRASKLREELDPNRVNTSIMDQFEELYDDAVKTKNQIVQSNLRLVVSIAKRHVSRSEDFFQLVSDGNMSLIRAVEKFDYARGNKFSTYASWAIMKNFARTIPEEFKHRDRYRTSAEEMFMAAPDLRSDRYHLESLQSMRESQIGKILNRLDEREQRIIISRFGLDHNEEPLTLKEVGAQLGVTKERIRQIEARALNKLRIAAQEEKIDVPE